ncbi:MAG: carboxypeptidase-like regulatory domain-containing protein [Olivibacter sp.]|nr:carboxypeptidase-like regulatory domain-containing protein [Olivibacter sp. UJ_SKK_5.1]
MKRKLLLFFVGLFFVPALLLAQEKTITGRVTAETDKSPLPGVSVKIKETNQGVTTNDIGSYSISAQIGQTLVFSYIGSNTKELIVGQENVINVQLELNETTLNEVVVVGFGKQKRANLTGAVSTVDVQKTFETRPITDPVRALQGTVPGLTITTPSGDLGTNPTIRLRGARGSINTGSTGA